MRAGLAASHPSASGCLVASRFPLLPRITHDEKRESLRSTSRVGRTPPTDRLGRMMPGQFFFTAVAGLSLSIAGFASLIAWLREDPQSWDPINLWRVKAIVREALALVFLALVLIPIFTLSEDIRTTIRFGAAGFILSVAFEMLVNREPDPAIWKPRVSWTMYMLFSVACIVFHLVNLWVASLGLLQLGALVALISPAGIFSNFVSEMGRNTSLGDNSNSDP
jgi:hypothetical protein